MSTNPRRDIEGKTVISYMIMTPIENTLKREQENGDATRVVTSAEIGTIDSQMPKIDADVKFHDVRLEVDKDKKRRELQKAIIKEQNRGKENEER